MRNRKKNEFTRSIRQAWQSGRLTPEQIERCKALGLTPVSPSKIDNQPVICYETDEEFESTSKAAQALGIKCGSSIKAAIKKGTACCGYHWYYADQPKPDPSTFAKPWKRAVICYETGKRFESCREIEKRVGISAANVGGAIKRKGTAGGYHWYYADQPKPDFEDLKQNRSRAVACYETGKIYKSERTAAKRMGVCVASIRQALKNNWLCCNYHWYYADQPKPDPATFKRTRQRAVVCYETGKTYNTPKEAAEAIGQKISSCIITAIKKGSAAGGYHWYYADQPKPDPARLL